MNECDEEVEVEGNYFGTPNKSNII